MKEKPILKKSILIITPQAAAVLENTVHKARDVRWDIHHPMAVLELHQGHFIITDYLSPSHYYRLYTTDDNPLPLFVSILTFLDDLNKLELTKETFLMNDPYLLNKAFPLLHRTAGHDIIVALASHAFPKFV